MFFVQCLTPDKTNKKKSKKKSLHLDKLTQLSEALQGLVKFINRRNIMRAHSSQRKTFNYT